MISRVQVPIVSTALRNFGLAEERASVQAEIVAGGRSEPGACRRRDMAASARQDGSDAMA